MKEGGGKEASAKPNEQRCCASSVELDIIFPHAKVHITKLKIDKGTICSAWLVSDRITKSSSIIISPLNRPEINVTGGRIRAEEKS